MWELGDRKKTTSLAQPHPGDTLNQERIGIYSRGREKKHLGEDETAPRKKRRTTVVTDASSSASASSSSDQQRLTRAQNNMDISLLIQSNFVVLLVK